MQERLHMTNHPGTNPDSFTTTISGIDEQYILLSESYCYPRGGGQPGDTGIFARNGGAMAFGEVLGGEFIRHPVQTPEEFSIGDLVECEIDSEVRNRHARMHTAQHIVSAMADDLWGAETVGNQISTNYTRIDLFFEDRAVYDSGTLEEEVNTIISTNTDVLVHDWTRDRILEHEQMRHTKFMDRIPSSIPSLRVVEVDGVDLCPCAGTHVSNTLDLESISITNVKSKGAGKYRITYQFESELE